MKNKNKLRKQSFQMTAIVAVIAIGFVALSIMSCDGNGGDNGSIPVTPGGLTATVVSSSQIDLAWNGVSGATGYYVYRSENSAGPFNQIGNPSTNSFSNTGLTANTTYYYRVAAYNSVGTSGQSAVAQATTQNGAATPTVTLTPASVTIDDDNLTATATVGGTATGTVTLDISALPSLVTAEVSGETITVTGVRPATEGGSINDSFTVVVTRGGITQDLTVNVNLTTTFGPTVPTGTQLLVNEWIDDPSNPNAENWLSQDKRSMTYWFPVTDGTTYHVWLGDNDYDNTFIDAIITGRYFGDSDTTYISVSGRRHPTTVFTNEPFNKVDPQHDFAINAPDSYPLTFIATKSGFAVITVERYVDRNGPSPDTAAGWFDLVYTIGN